MKEDGGQMTIPIKIRESADTANWFVNAIDQTFCSDLKRIKEEVDAKQHE